MSSDATEITHRRTLQIADLQWAVSEFNRGDHHILAVTASNSSVQFAVHFDAQQWAEFQKLVSP